MPVFGYKVYVIVTNSVLESRKRRGNILGKVDDSIPTIAMCSHGEAESSFSYIFIKPTANAGTIAHEVYHSLCNMFRYISADYEEEIMAYHLTYLVDEIEKLKKIKLLKQKQ
jgi:hypothetical protein